MSKKHLEKRIALGVAIAHFTNDLPSSLFPAVLPIVIKEFMLSYTMVGLIIALSSSLTTGLQSITGYIADRANKIKLLTIGLIILGLSIALTGFSKDYTQLIFFQCLLGVGASFFHPIGISSLSDYFKSSERGKALGIGSAAGDAAVPAAFIIASLLLPLINWRSLYVLWGLITMLVGVGIFALLKDFKEIPRKESHSIELKNAIKSLYDLFPVILLMILLSGVYRLIASFTTTYLTSKGISIGISNAIMAFMMSIGIFGALLSGWLISKLSEKNIVLGSILALTILLIIFSSLPLSFVSLFFIVLFGFPLMAIWPALYSLISKATSIGKRAFIYGLLFSIGWGFGSFFPYLAGALSDIFGLKIVYLIALILSFISVLIVYAKL
ncbi:MAG: MFS transporter [Candidatus Bathyarchaeia archaeon]